MAPVSTSPTTIDASLGFFNEENKVTSISVSDEERLSGIPSQETVGAAVSILHRDGIVVLDNVVDQEHVKILNDTLCSEVPALVADPSTNWNGGRERGNISQPPPFTKELMFPDIWANVFTTAVISSILGPRPHVNYVNGNTALPDTYGRQEVHADLNFNYPSHPFAMVANYYLCDTDESNGATEIWLRSHHETHFDMHRPSQSWIKKDTVKERAATTKFPPIRPSIKRGSVVIRDLRLWHAGRSNPSKSPRIMLAFVHFPWWYQNQQRIMLPESARPLIEAVGNRLVYDVDFVAGGVNHMKTEFAANFESGNEAYRATITPCVNISKAVNDKQQARLADLNGVNHQEETFGGPVKT